MRNAKKDERKFMDRLAIGFLNLILGVITGTLIWLAFNGFFIYFEKIWLSPYFILWFTGGMVALGLVLQEAIFIQIYSNTWRLLYNLFRHW
jgi:ABC-type lipoprotein release transport system permease subunit